MIPWTNTILTIIAVGGFILSLIANGKNNKKDVSDNAEKGSMMLSDIGYIKSGIDDIKAEQREQRRINTEFYTRLAMVESSAKQAHKRIDRIEGIEDKREN